MLQARTIILHYVSECFDIAQMKCFLLGTTGKGAGWQSSADPFGCFLTTAEGVQTCVPNIGCIQMDQLCVVPGLQTRFANAACWFCSVPALSKHMHDMHVSRRTALELTLGEEQSMLKCCRALRQSAWLLASLTCRRAIGTKCAGLTRCRSVEYKPKASAGSCSVPAWQNGSPSAAALTVPEPMLCLQATRAAASSHQ